MQTYKLKLIYDGSAYKGWQRQVTTDKTIQGILEKTISDICGYQVEVDGSGRTDGGVHSKGQTASVELKRIVNPEEFKSDINERLPEDIKVSEVEKMRKSFHARYDAKGKHYSYTVDTNEKANVFIRKYAYHLPCDIKIEEMKRAADYLIGQHDYSAFTDLKDETKSRNRYIEKITITKNKSIIRLDFYGNGFLYHMVRILTGTLLEAGRGIKSPEEVKQILKSKDRSKAGGLVPAKGLVLEEVYY